MKILTTLAENNYFYGVAALLNSVIANGTYIDKVVIGFRGELPKWFPELKKSKNGKSFILNNLIEVELVEVKGALHMVHEKPKWFEYLTFELELDAEEFYFFDSDITILNRMQFFGEWSKEGIALCEDINYDMSETHPIRKQWAKIAIENGFTVKRNLGRYYNSGFLGWRKENKQFIKDWSNSFDILKEFSGSMKEFRVQDRTYTVLSANQDSINLAAMVTDCAISVIGPEAMGFHYGLRLMAHPLGPKPWEINFLRDALKGKSPRRADLEFWKVVNGNHLKPYKQSHIKSKILFIKISKFISRFYKKIS